MRQKQTGSILILALLVLATLTMLALSVSSMSRVEQRVTGNLRDRQLAEQAAHAALEMGKDWLEGQMTAPTPVTDPSTATTTTVFATNLTNNYPRLESDASAGLSLLNSQRNWLLSYGVNYFDYTSQRIVADLADSAQPKLMIQLASSTAYENVYSLVALAQGRTPSTYVIRETSVTLHKAAFKFQCDNECTVTHYKGATNQAYGPYSNWLTLQEIEIFNVVAGDYIDIEITASSGQYRGLVGHIDWLNQTFETNPYYYQLQGDTRYQLIRDQDFSIPDKWHSNTNPLIAASAVWISNYNWHGAYTHAGAADAFTYRWTAQRKIPLYLAAGCQDTSFNFQCDLATQAIKVQLEWYGTNQATGSSTLCAGQGTILNAPGGPEGFTTTSNLKSIIDGQYGTITVTSAAAGVDPAVGQSKYFYLYYTCD